MLAVLWALPLAAPTGEGQGQAAIAPGIDPFTDPATGRILNRWNQKWRGFSGLNQQGEVSEDFSSHGKWTPAIDAAAAFCAYRNTKYALDGVWTLKHKDTCAAACNYVNAAGWVLYEEHQLYDSVSNDTNNADVWYNGVSGTSEGNGPFPSAPESDLMYSKDCLIAFHGAQPTEGHNRPAVNDESVYGEYMGIAGIAKRWTEELETMTDRISKLHGNMSNFGLSMRGDLHVTGHANGGTLASIFAHLANHKDDPLEFHKPVTTLTVYGVPPSANFSMDNGQRADGCFEGTAYYTRLPKYTPYIDAPEGLDRHIVDIFTIMSGYPVSKEVQDAVRDHSVFEDLDHVGVHIKHAIHTRKSQHVRLPWKSLDITGMITDDVVDPMDNLKHLVGPVHFNKCGREPPSFRKMANDPDLAVRAANESNLEWKALTMEGYQDQKVKCLTRACAENSGASALEHGADALNMHAPETYFFSVCVHDPQCKGFMFVVGEPGRTIHDKNFPKPSEDPMHRLLQRSTPVPLVDRTPA
jgi:hypothetical protein